MIILLARSRNKFWQAKNSEKCMIDQIGYSGLRVEKDFVSEQSE